MRDRPERGFFPPHYALLNPQMPWYADWVRVLGCDYLEVESPELVAGPTGPAVRIEVRALGQASLIKVCELIARDHPHLSQFGAFLDAVQGEGIMIPASRCLLVSDPVGEAEMFRKKADA